MLFPGQKQGERRLQDELCDYGILSNASSHKVKWCSTWNVLQSPVCANALHTAKFPVFLNYRTPFSGRPSWRCYSSEHAMETLLCAEKGDYCWRGWLQWWLVEPMVILPWTPSEAEPNHIFPPLIWWPKSPSHGLKSHHHNHCFLCTQEDKEEER